ncbi:MAG: hypothetical protein V1794_14165 [Candidatus Glassbacteria bacterium]
MIRLTRIASLANLYATLCLVVFNCWLGLHHGHDSRDYFNLRGRTPRVVLEGIHCHNSTASRPLFESHSLRFKAELDCPLCTFTDWNSFQAGIVSCGYDNIPRGTNPTPARQFREYAIQSTCYLRAPPGSSGYSIS